MIRTTSCFGPGVAVAMEASFLGQPRRMRASILGRIMRGKIKQRG